MALPGNPLQNRVNVDADGRKNDNDPNYKRGSYDNEFGNPSYSSDTSSAQDQAHRAAALGGAMEGMGDYSNDAAEKRERYAAWANEHGMEGSGDPNAFINPGSADYGGQGGVEFYRNQAIAGGQANDAQQKMNADAMGVSFGNMTGDRGPIHQENGILSGRAAQTRDQQIQALNLSRDAAMGRAPSEAAFQTRLGMNDIAGQHSGQMGSARGLSALGAAQTMGGASAGESAGNLSMAGGLARSKEIGDAIGMYGTQAGSVRDQDLSRLGMNAQNSMFNAKANDDWKLGNANLLAQQGQLANTQQGTDLAWMGEQQRGQDKQFQYDQEMAAKEAGADADAVGAAIAKNREDKEHTRQTINAGVSTGLTAVGSAFGGPVGGAAGGAAGQAFGSATKDWDW